ncbi:MAG: hypothetical protein B6U97_02860 [Candidatus Altiarchaeales archaeon ex4484_96]|nr:MAG: hypothetical protein B6U97_02860 [Candidatus Altiarchaeales archaeon ex4484_96]
MKTVVGFIGEIGSGKTKAAEFLVKEYKANYLRYSQIFMDLLNRLNLPINRVNLQKLGRVLREEFGSDVIVNAFMKDLEGCDSDVVVIDGIRYQNEVDLLRKYPHNILIYIHSEPRQRYERIKKRGEKDESNISWMEFIKADESETEKYIKQLSAEADYIINNQGPVKQLEDALEKIIDKEKNSS